MIDLLIRVGYILLVLAVIFALRLHVAHLADRAGGPALGIIRPSLTEPMTLPLQIKRGPPPWRVTHARRVDLNLQPLQMIGR